MRSITSVLLAALTSACGAGHSPSPTAELDLNDVSFLYPLSSASDGGDLLHLDASGDVGVLVTRQIFDSVAFQLVSERPADLYSTMRVVSARVDPCFPKDDSDAPPCRKQLRLVAQPTFTDPATGTRTTTDAAVHLFYDLTEAQFSALTADLVELRTLAGERTRGKPLSIHPVMAVEGLDGPYTKRLNRLILKHAGLERLTRLAMFNLVKKDLTWTFTAADRSDGAFRVDQPLPTLTQNTQIFALMPDAEDKVSPQSGLLVDPKPQGITFALDRLPDPTTSDAELTGALKRALFVERPSPTSNPQRIDCASCHVANRERLLAEKARGRSTADWPERYVNARFDLRRVDQAGDNPSVLRSFGYFKDQSAINQRTINESAEVADALSGR